MDEQPNLEATRQSYWRSLTRKRKVLLGAGAAAVVLLIVAGALALATSDPSDGDGGGETSRTITPAEETTETTVPVGTAEETASAEATAPGTVEVQPVQPGRAPLVAYRREGWLCVAGEDGAGERRIVASATGVFSLAPSGTALAYVDASAGTLVIADLAAGTSVNVGPALQAPPSWSSDSAWIAYTGPGPSVMRVTRFGSYGTELFAGTLPTVSVRDATVVGLAPGGEIVVWTASGSSRVSATGTVTGLATNGATIFYGAIAEGGAVSLRAMGVDGRGDRAVISGASSSRQVTLGDLMLSPSQELLAYAEVSDDGYSRLFALATSGGAATALSVRRDCYPLRWTADGSAILYIEGNSFQGDPTALMRVRADGGSRRLLVSGADR